MTAKILQFPTPKAAVDTPVPEQPAERRALRIAFKVAVTDDGFMVLHFLDDRVRQEFECDGILVDNTSDVLEQIIGLLPKG